MDDDAAARPDDVAAMMEALWGPPREAPFDDVAGRRRPRSQPVDQPEPAPTPRPPALPAPGLAGLRPALEAILDGQVERLRSELMSAVAGVESRLDERLDALAGEVAALRSQGEADRRRVDDEVQQRLTALADRVELIHAEAVEAAAAQQDALGARLDQVGKAVGALQSSSVSVAGLDGLRADVEGALEDRPTRAAVDEGLAAIRAAAAEQSGGELVVAATELNRKIDAVGARLDEVASTAAGLAARADAASAEAQAAGQEMDEKLAQLGSSIEAGRAELATLQAGLEQVAQAVEGVRAEVARRVPDDEHSRLAAHVAALAEQVESVDDRIGDVQAVVDERLRVPSDITLAASSARLGRRASRRQQDELGADLARLSEAVEAWREESIGKDEFEALRSELKEALSTQMNMAQAELRRRLALLDSSFAEAKAQLRERLDQMARLVSTQAAQAAERAAGEANEVAAPLLMDVGELRGQVEHLRLVVAALQERQPRS